MNFSDNCLKMVEKYEGLRLNAYKDPAGIPTIGYGHTKGVYMGMTITQRQAGELLRVDMDNAWRNVQKYNNVYNWNQNETDALTSFAYNIGSIDQLTGNGTRTRSQIARSMLLYTHAGGQILEGLKKRRKEEHDLFLRPVTKTETAKPTFIKWKDYIVTPKVGLNVRYYPDTHAKICRVYPCGTVFTVFDIKDVKGDTWLRTPSGWVCGYQEQYNATYAREK